MTIWTWPAELPQRPLVEGYSEEMADLDLASQMDIGPAKVRRLTTAAPRPLTVPFKMTDWQKQRLKRLYSEEARGRTNLGWFPEPGVDGFPLLDGDGVTGLTDEHGTPLLITSRVLVRFARPPVFTPASRPQLGWMVALQFEVMP